MSCPNGSFDAVLSMYITPLSGSMAFLEGYRQDKLVTSATLVLGPYLVGPAPKRFKYELSEFRSIDFLTFRATSFLMDDLPVDIVIRCNMK